MNCNDNFRYLYMGLPEDIMRRKMSGDIEGAVRLIDQKLMRKELPQAMRCCLTAQREMLLRQSEDFPFTREQALARIRSKIPDFTEEEFDAWTEAGQIRWCYLQGEPRYFDRFLESLCKSEPEIGRRAGIFLPGNESAANGSQADARIQQCMKIMKSQGEMRVRIRIRASVKLSKEQFTPGMFVRVHLPIPAACDQQSTIQIEEIFPKGAVAAPEDAAQRTICWEEQMETNHEFAVQYSYIHTARYTDTTGMPGAGEQGTKKIIYKESENTGRQKEKPENTAGMESFIAEQAPHIQFTPYVRELTDEVIADAADPLEKARRIYDFITLNMKYTYMPSYFCLENIAENCARSYTGDCGVLALLFLTMCRCAKIPACWQSGLTAEPDFCGAHDWVRFYVAPYGWLYADPSYGVAAVRMGDEGRRKFYFGNLDPYRMVANRKFQVSFTVDKQHWRADPYDNQVGEMETADKGLRYSEFERKKQVLTCEVL